MPVKNQFYTNIRRFKDINALPFAQSIGVRREIEKWKKSASSSHIRQKRCSTKAAIRNFCSDNDVLEYLAMVREGPGYRDDCFELFYTTQENSPDPQPQEPNCIHCTVLALKFHEILLSGDIPSPEAFAERYLNGIGPFERSVAEAEGITV